MAGWPAVLLRAASDESPKIGIEGSEFFLHGEECGSVLNGRGDFQAVAYDSRVGEQLVQFILTVAGDDPRIKAIEGGAVVLPLAQDGLPTQAGLCSLQDQEFK